MEGSNAVPHSPDRTDIQSRLESQCYFDSGRLAGGGLIKTDSILYHDFGGAETTGFACRSRLFLDTEQSVEATESRTCGRVTGGSELGRRFGQMRAPPSLAGTLGHTFTSRKDNS